MHEATESTTDPSPRKSRRRSNVRWIIAVLLGVGLIVAFVDRANLSVAMPQISEEFGISPAMQGVILGAWVWTYALFQLPAGWLADKFGTRFIYAAAVVWWSLTTGLTALVRGTVSLLGMRLLLGVGEAPIMPASAKAVSEWFPKKERGTASGVYGAGSEAGAAIAVPFVALLMAYASWRQMFIVCGLLGVLVTALWLWIYRKPREHKWVNAAELEHIERGGAHTAEAAHDEEPDQERGTSIPWIQLFRFPTIWGMFSGYICRNFLNYFFITWYPTYLVSAKGFSTMDLAAYGAIPAVVAIIANFAGGAFTDWLLRRGLSLAVARKIPILFGTFAAATIGLTAFTESPIMAVALLSLGYAGSSFAAAAILSLPIDVAPGPGNVSSIYGIQNLGSQIGGLASPLVIGFIVGATGSFVIPLALMGVLCLVGAAIYAFVVKVEPLRLPSQHAAS